jgi:hypothetical protein
MTAELEITNGVASFAFNGQRKDIWHRLGQQFHGTGLMPADEAMRLAHMDRNLRVVDFPDLEGIDHWSIDRPSILVLEGKMFATETGDLVNIPDKVVGLAGNQAVQGHSDLSMLDRFQLAEEAIHASHGAAVWSTAGLLRDGTQGFATMEAPPIIIDPNGIADIVRSYLTVTWSFDGSRATELGASNIRVVCANTLAMHDGSKGKPVIKVKATSGAHDRMRLAAQHWAMAQDEQKALTLRAERMLAVANGKTVLKGLAENVLGLKVDATTPKRATTLRNNKLDELRVLYAATTNSASVGDNGYAAFQTVVEYLDWFAPVKADANDQDACTTQRVANQFDGTYDGLKSQAAEYVLSLA